MKITFSVASIIASSFLISPVVNAENLYGSLKILDAKQSLSNLKPYSPRATQMLSGPSSDSGASVSMALGYMLPDNWRVEAEYTTPKKSTFESFWAPFSANVQSLHTSSQRLMVNGYKDFPLNTLISLYGTAGIGLAMIDADGYQGNTARSFEKKSQTNFSYGLGLGADFHVHKAFTLGVGYRYVGMGNIKTGYNTFTNVANARDEQLNGKLSERNIFMELRGSF